MRKVKSTCSYCGVGCGVEIEHNPKTGEIFVSGDESHPVNRGMLCSKGMNLDHATMDTSDRLLYPEMRYNKYLPKERVSWETAMTRAAKVFQAIIKNHGPDSVAFYVSGQLLTEEYYIINKLVKGYLGTAHIDTNSRLCMSSAVVGYKKALGEDVVPICYDDIELADCFLITGANPAWCHPIIFRRIEAHKEKNPNTKIIVIDPRRTQSAMVADLHLQIHPGTDVFINNCISRILIENDWIDKEFIQNNTDGFDNLKKEAFIYSVSDVAQICKVEEKDIFTAAKWIAESKGFLSMWTMGLNQSSIGVNKNLSLINLHLITGKIGKPGSGPFSLTGQPNAMGGREVGGLSTMLASHMELSNPDHRQKMADFWGVPKVADKPGYTATQIIDKALEGKLKALWVVCTNPLVSLPDTRRAEMALKKLPFLVLQDISSSNSAYEYADLVLPAAGYMEKTGTMTNSDRRVSLVQKVIEPPGEALPDAEIIWKFADRMGWKKGFDYSSYEEIYNEYKQTTKDSKIDVSEIYYNLLKEKGTLQWPYVNGKETPRLFTDLKFYTPNGKAQIFGKSPDNLSENISKQYPFILTTGRIRDQWHTMTRTGKVEKLKNHIHEPFLELNPSDAKKLEITEDSLVNVQGKRGTVRVRAKITENIKEGVVFLPMHWGKKLDNDLSRANNLTSNILDEVSLQPDYKFSAVSINPHKIERKKIVIVGAGAGATQFIQSYREIDKESDIHVFSSEKNLFYNRVLLPDYLYGEKNWNSLQKMNAEQLEEYNLFVHESERINEINAKEKTIISSKGVTHSYDELIVATGSRPFIPKDFPKEVGNFFTIRQKENADALLKQMETVEKVVIIGGGLLGIEMAGAFNELNKEVTVIQRSNRLMERQLDEIASQLLLEELELREVKVLLNDEVVKFNNIENKIKSVELLSGKTLNADVVICAIGTQPNTKILKDAGANCVRGVAVNEHLETSLPNIYAIGEVAELNGESWGITAAAEEQANVLVKVLEGDPQASYHGSLSMNILKLKNLNLCSIGEVLTPENDKDVQVVKIEDLNRRYYKKCLIRKNKLVGAVLVGNKDEFPEFKDLIGSSKELNEIRDLLLRNTGIKSEPLKGKLVCSCNNVGEGNLEEAIKKGACSTDELMKVTNAGSGCGSCKPEVIEFLNKNLIALPNA